MGRSKSDTRGMDLATLADHAIVPAIVLSRIRDTHAIARKISRLRLFGDDADVKVGEEDESLVRLFKEWGKMYQVAVGEGDMKGARETLSGLTKLHLGFSAKEESILGQCVKIQIKAAELAAKAGDVDGGFSEAELMGQAGEDDVPIVVTDV